MPPLWRDDEGWEALTEAECEPLPSLHNLAAEVTTVLALHSDVLVALQQGLESYEALSQLMFRNEPSRSCRKRRLSLLLARSR